MKKRLIALALGVTFLFTSVPSVYGIGNDVDIYSQEMAENSEIEDGIEDTESTESTQEPLAMEDTESVDNITEQENTEDESQEKEVASNPSLSESDIKVNIFGYTALEDGTYNTGTKIQVLDVVSKETITAESGDENLVVSVAQDFVNIFPKKVGEYVVTITADNKKMTANVKVSKVYFKRHKYSAGDRGDKNWVDGSTMLGLYKGESATLVPKGFAVDSKKKWYSSDKSVATVNSEGVVTAKSLGYATISLECEGYTLTYKVGVSYKEAIKALRFCIKYYGYPYSQPKRMQDGYFDCSSYVWRAYRSAGMYIGGSKTWAPTAAAQAYWGMQKHYTMYEGTVPLDDLLPGDLIYWTGKKNGRYKGIFHVDMYQGAGWIITNTNQKYRVGSISGAIVVRPCCTKVTSLKVSNTAFKYNKIKWNGCFGATGYKLYRSTKKDGKYEKIATIKDSKEYIDLDIKTGKTYYYKIKPYWKNTKATYAGKMSDIKKKTTKAVYPQIKAKSISTGIKISWNLISGADCYIIYRKRHAQDKWEEYALSQSSTKTSYTDKKVKKDKTYIYTVRACKGKYKGYINNDGIKIKYVPKKSK